MRSCCFAGPYKVNLCKKEEEMLKKTIWYLIEEENIREFCICNLGVFNQYVMGMLFEFKKNYTDIILQVVVPCIDEEMKNVLNSRGELIRIVSAEIDEELPSKQSVMKTIEYMVEEADFLICYRDNSCYETDYAIKTAEKMSKKIINICCY